MRGRGRTGPKRGERRPRAAPWRSAADSGTGGRYGCGAIDTARGRLLNDTTTTGGGMGALLLDYAALWAGYAAAPLDRTLDDSDKENTFDAAWKLDHYFSVGADALRIIVAALIAAGRPAPGRILDFPSGSGRVTRHLRAMFPGAEIGACDLYQEHIDFCAAQFGAVPLLSREDPGALDVGQWDVVFCGSLLTHLPLPLFTRVIDFIVRTLAPGGIAVVTLEGRHAVHIQDHKWRLIAQDRFEVARKGFLRDGFGFVDYRHDFRKALFSSQESYGVTLVTPARIMAMLQARDDLRIMGFAERAWDDHQDVVVFGKPGVND